MEAKLRAHLYRTEEGIYFVLRKIDGKNKIVELKGRKAEWKKVNADVKNQKKVEGFSDEEKTTNPLSRKDNNLKLPNENWIDKRARQMKEGFENLSRSCDGGIIESYSSPLVGILRRRDCNLGKGGLCSAENEGIDPHKEGEGKYSSDDMTMIELGFDFGTSSAKVVARDLSRNLCFAVPMMETSGIEAYLLETGLQVDSNGVCSLLPQNASEGTVYRNIKMDLMTDLSAVECQIRVVAFWALWIRHVRAWIYKKFNLDGVSVWWKCRIGFPSASSNAEMKSLWETLFRIAWYVADENRSVTETLVREKMQTSLDEEYPELEAFAEVFAEAVGIVENHPREQSDQFYTLVDIGSSTVDVSAFCMSSPPNEEEKHFQDYDHAVYTIGTTVWHHARLKTWANALEHVSVTAGLDEDFSALNNWIKQELREALIYALPLSVDDYVQGATLREEEPGTDAAMSLLFALAVFWVRRAAAQIIGEDRVKLKMHLILCGGGSRSKSYLDALGVYSKEYLNNITWARFPMPEHLETISELNYWAVPVSTTDHDRLLVAYGLCVGQFGTYCIGSEKDRIEPEYRDTSSAFIRKEDT